MCDLDEAKTNLESLLDIVRDLKAERDRLAKALLEISNLDNSSPEIPGRLIRKCSK